MGVPGITILSIFSQIPASLERRKLVPCLVSHRQAFRESPPPPAARCLTKLSPSGSDMGRRCLTHVVLEEARSEY